MKVTFLTVIGLGVLAIGAQAFANTTHLSFIDVPGSVSFDGWNQINRTGMGGGDQTTATNALIDGFGSNVPGSGDAILKRVSGSVYPAGAGLYGDGVLTFTDSTVSGDITSLELQGIINNFDTQPFQLSLSYNGGSQNLVPSLLTFTDTGATQDYYHYSWDLAGIGETINSYAVTLSFGFAQSLAFQVDQATSVPEPGCFALLCVAGAAFAGRRRARLLS